MNTTPPSLSLPRVFLLLLLGGATIAFLWLIAPFSGAILWAIVAAILFEPLNAGLLARMPRRRNAAAAISLLVIFVVVVVPALLLGAALAGEFTDFYARVQSGKIDIGRVFADIVRHLPPWARAWLAEVGMGDVDGLRARIGEGLANSFRAIAAQVLDIGKGAFAFFLALGVMLYVTFFLLRDGHAIAERVQRALPLPLEQREILVSRLALVVRATIKGSLIVAIAQGTVGGFLFWMLGLPGALLWGVTMGVFSLFPAVGTGFVWVPIGVYLLATGEIWQGTVLLLCGFFIVSSVDNVVRPILVGRDARMPDYIVLVATLGGFELMGFNGFVIGPMIAALFLAAWDMVSTTQEPIGPERS